MLKDPSFLSAFSGNTKKKKCDHYLKTKKAGILATSKAFIVSGI